MARRPLLLAALVTALVPATASAAPTLSYPAANGPLTITAGADAMSVQVTGFRGIFCGGPCSTSHDVRSLGGWAAEAGLCDADGSDSSLYHCGARPAADDHPSVTIVAGSPQGDVVSGSCSSGGGPFVIINLYSPVIQADGGAGDDTLEGSCANDTLSGGPGDDTLDGRPGNDTLDGGDGLDDIAGGSGNDPISAGPGRDTVSAGAGDDVIDGGAEPDRIDAGDGNDTISGGAGGDYIVPGIGTDTVEGGEGRDTVSYEDRDAATALVIRLDGSALSGASGELDTIQPDVESVVGGAGADTITGSAAPNDIDAGTSNDSLDPGAGTDVVDAGDGDDTINALDGAPDTVECGAGNDTVSADELDTLSNCEAVTASRELMADVDNDGVNAPADCNDRDASVRPGLPDKPGDGVDQDCSGADAPYPRVLSGVTSKFNAGARTRVLRLDVFDLAPGARVSLRCLGKRCFKKARSVKVPAAGAGQVRAAGRVRKVRFRPGQTLELRILVPEQIGKVVRFKMKRRDLPSSRNLCMPPGATKPGTC